MTNWHPSEYRALVQQLPDPTQALPVALAQVSANLTPQNFTMAELFQRAAEILHAPTPAQKISLLTQTFRELPPAESHGLVRWLSAEPGLGAPESLLTSAMERLPINQRQLLIERRQANAPTTATKPLATTDFPLLDLGE